MRNLVILALLIAFIPVAVWAGDCNSCGSKPVCKQNCGTPKCDTCKPKCETKCNTCKPACENKCKPACENKCKPACENKCKPACENKCKPKCENKCKPKCENKCNSCAPAPACPQPCACDAWVPYCGCEEITSLCITMQACEGTAGPLWLQIRDPKYATLAMIELAGPIDGYYNMTYTFEKPVPASALMEAVLINKTDDAVTMTSMRVVGMNECFSYVYIDKTCSGMVIGKEGCPRLVMY